MVKLYTMIVAAIILMTGCGGGSLTIPALTEGGGVEAGGTSKTCADNEVMFMNNCVVENFMGATGEPCDTAWAPCTSCDVTGAECESTGTCIPYDKLATYDVGGTYDMNSNENCSLMCFDMKVLGALMSIPKEANCTVDDMGAQWITNRAQCAPLNLYGCLGSYPLGNSNVEPTFACTSKAYGGGFNEFSATFDQGNAQDPHLNLIMEHNGVRCSVPLIEDRNDIDLQDLSPVPNPTPEDPDNKELSAATTFILEGLMNCANVIVGMDLQAIAESIEGLSDGTYTVGFLMDLTAITQGDIMSTLTFAGLIGATLPCLVNDGLAKSVLWVEGAPLTNAIFWQQLMDTELDIGDTNPPPP